MIRDRHKIFETIHPTEFRLLTTMTTATTSYDTYTTPLTSRYASREMCSLFSPARRHATWRKLWLDLATAEKELGLEISDDAIKQMTEHLELTPQDWSIAEQEEKLRRYLVLEESSMGSLPKT
jgi:hypothetical protein